MKAVVLIFLSFVLSCSSPLRSTANLNGKKTFSYTDVTGTYQLVRESKLVDQKLVTRNMLVSSTGNKILEKNVQVSQLGSIKSGGKRILILRPLASEFEVWLEGKKYSSSMRLDVKAKAMQINLKSPEEKWNGTKSVTFPRSKYFCFFSQVSECLQSMQFLDRAKQKSNSKLTFYIIWDGWPFIQDQLSSVGKELFSEASLRFDGEYKKLFRYEVETEGQIILYHFSKSQELVKITWISQGITVVPPGEEEVHEDE